jgi:serine/threonine protein kinase
MLLLCVQGGFSEVHLAYDQLTGKEVALKVVFLNKGGLTKDQVRIWHT